MRDARAAKDSGSKRQIPDLPQHMEAPNEAALRLTDISLSGAQVDDLKLDTLADRTLRIEGSVLSRVSLPGCSFSSVKLKDVRFVGCDLANVKMLGLNLVRVEFVNCRMTGFHAVEAKCQDLLVREGDQRYSQFRFSNFKRVEFDACDFDDADFYGADLRNSVFRKCSLRKAEMSEARLQGADLRGSSIDDLRLNAKDIFGAIVDPSQAMIFARLLGIRIE